VAGCENQMADVVLDIQGHLSLCHPEAIRRILNINTILYRILGFFAQSSE